MLISKLTLGQLDSISRPLAPHADCGMLAAQVPRAVQLLWMSRTSPIIARKISKLSPQEHQLLPLAGLVAGCPAVPGTELQRPNRGLVRLDFCVTTLILQGGHGWPSSEADHRRCAQSVPLIVRSYCTCMSATGSSTRSHQCDSFSSLSWKTHRGRLTDVVLPIDGVQIYSVRKARVASAVKFPDTRVARLEYLGTSTDCSECKSSHGIQAVKNSTFVPSRSVFRPNSQIFSVPRR